MCNRRTRPGACTVCSGNEPASRVRPSAKWASPSRRIPFVQVGSHATHRWAACLGRLTVSIPACASLKTIEQEPTMHPKHETSVRVPPGRRPGGPCASAQELDWSASRARLDRVHSLRCSVPTPSGPGMNRRKKIYFFCCGPVAVAVLSLTCQQHVPGRSHRLERRHCLPPGSQQPCPRGSPSD